MKEFGVPPEVDVPVHTGIVMKAEATIENGDPVVVCPHCGHKNCFPGWGEIDVFICEGCGEPVEVANTLQ
jgi:hypothetical protein